MLWLILAFLILGVFVLSWWGIIDDLIHPDRPRAPKLTLSRAENQRRDAAYRAAVEEWKQWRKGLLLGQHRTHPERSYEQNFRFYDVRGKRAQRQG